jgi:hypothetical protein
LSFACSPLSACREVRAMAKYFKLCAN